MRRRTAALTKVVGLLVMVGLLTSLLGAPAFAGERVPAGERRCITVKLDADLQAKLKIGSELYVKDASGSVIAVATVVKVGLDVKLRVCLKVDVDAEVEIGAAVKLSDGSLVIPLKVKADVDGNVVVTANLKAKVAGLLTLLAKVKAKVKVKADVWVKLFVVVDP